MNDYLNKNVFKLNVWFILLTFLFSFFFAFVIKKFFFAIYAVESVSMNNTIFEDDKILIKKNTAPYSPNSIVIFNYHDVNYIKRVVGKPGDSVKIINNVVYRNNKIVKFPSTILTEEKKTNLKIKEFDEEIFFIYSQFWTKQNWGSILIPRKGQKITLSSNNLKIYRSIIDLENSTTFFSKLEVDSSKYYIFKNNYYFVLGDNRPLSQDSRQIGLVNEDQIIGTATYLLYSPKRNKYFKEIE